MTEELFLFRVERDNLKADLDDMTALPQRMKNNVRRSLSNVPTDSQKFYEDMVKAFKLKIQTDPCRRLEEVGNSHPH